MCCLKLARFSLTVSLVWLVISVPIFVSNLDVANTAGENTLAAREWYLQTVDKAAFLYLKEVGQGELVIVLHGGPGADHRYLTAIADGLQRQFRFIFYDQRGSGLSFCPKEIVSMEKTVQDLETIRQALGKARINLISHSFGTMLAMNYLQAYPQNVKNLVLLGALDPKNGNRAYFTPAELENFARRNDEIKRFNGRPEVRIQIERAGLNKPSLTPYEASQLRRINSAAGSIYKVTRWRQNVFFIANKETAQAIRNSTNFVYDWTKILSAHPFPLTVINGEYDYVVGSKGSPIWKRVVKTEATNVRLVLIQDAGHNSWIDDPEKFRNALRQALMRKQ